MFYEHKFWLLLLSDSINWDKWPTFSLPWFSYLKTYLWFGLVTELQGGKTKKLRWNVHNHETFTCTQPFSRSGPSLEIFFLYSSMYSSLYPVLTLSATSACSQRAVESTVTDNPWGVPRCKSESPASQPLRTVRSTSTNLSFLKPSTEDWKWYPWDPSHW